MKFDLIRFIEAQSPVYDDVLSELNAGRKQSHWMWFIFPQVEGLGRSETARFYAIQGRPEARAYLDHPILGRRLLECTQAMLRHQNQSALDILGSPDDFKFRSSMTLFAEVSATRSLFEQALETFFEGEKDQATLTRLP